MRLLQPAFDVIRQNRKAYIALNAVYYGLVILAMIYVFTNPSLQRNLLDAVGQSFAEGPLSAVSDAYTGAQVIPAMLLTFVVNLLLGSFAEITIPSLIVPFSGLLMGVIRAVLWGLLLSPAEPTLAGAMIPHSLTLLLEGQGYVLAMLAAVAHGRAFLWPGSVGVQGHARGYLTGLKQSAWLYVLVALVLAIAAIYEALEVIFLAPLFV